MFDYKFWDKIKNVIKTLHLNFLYDYIGSNYLSDEEIDFLKKEIGENKLKEGKVSQLDKIYILGQLSRKLGIKNMNTLNLKDIDSYIDGFKNIKEKFNLVSDKLSKLKKQAYLDILGKQYKIEKEVRQIILNNQDDKEKITISKVTKDLKNKFEDWSDLNNSTSYISESAFNEGKIEDMKHEEGEKYVYKEVTKDERLCSICRKLYLNSDNSPKIYKLSELEANGTNIGKKQVDWLPTVSSTHPNCRCLLQYLNVLPGTKVTDYIWNGSLYVLKDEIKKKKKVERKSKVHIQIGDKHFDV